MPMSSAPSPLSPAGTSFLLPNLKLLMSQLIVLTVDIPLLHHHDHPRMLRLLLRALLLEVEQLPPSETLLNLVELGRIQPPVLCNRLKLLIVLVLGGLELMPVLVVDASQFSEVLFSNSIKVNLNKYFQVGMIKTIERSFWEIII